MKVTLDLTPAQLESITAQVAGAPAPVTPDEPAPALGLDTSFRQYFGAAFGTSDKTFESDVLTDIPYTAGPFRFRFLVGDELAIDTEVDHWGGFVRCHRVRDELERWADKRDGTWVARKGYAKLVDSILARGLGEDEFALWPKDYSDDPILPAVAYDGRHCRLEVYSERGLELNIDINGAIPKEYFIFSLAHRGVFEELGYVFV